jgi:hypothetical protein
VFVKNSIEMAHQIPIQGGDVTQIRRGVFSPNGQCLAITCPNFIFQDDPRSFHQIIEEYKHYRSLVIALISITKRFNAQAVEAKGADLSEDDGAVLIKEVIPYGGNVSEYDRSRYGFSAVRLIYKSKIFIPVKEEDDDDDYDDDFDDGNSRPWKRSRFKKKEYKQEDFTASKIATELMREHSFNAAKNKKYEKKNARKSWYDEESFWCEHSTGKLATAISLYCQDPTTTSFGQLPLYIPTHPYNLNKRLSLWDSFFPLKEDDVLTEPDMRFLDSGNYASGGVPVNDAKMHDASDDDEDMIDDDGIPMPVQIASLPRHDGSAQYLTFPDVKHTLQLQTSSNDAVRLIMTGIWPSTLDLDWRLDSTFVARIKRFDKGRKARGEEKMTGEEINADYDEYSKTVTDIDPSHGNMDLALLKESITTEKAEIDVKIQEMEDLDLALFKTKYTRNRLALLIKAVFGVKYIEEKIGDSELSRDELLGHFNADQLGMLMKRASDINRTNAKNLMLHELESRSIKRFQSALRTESETKGKVKMFMNFGRKWLRDQENFDVKTPKTLCLPKNSTYYCPNLSSFASMCNTLVMKTKETTNTATLSRLSFKILVGAMHVLLTYRLFHINTILEGVAEQGKSWVTRILQMMFPGNTEMMSFTTAKSWTAGGNDNMHLTVVIYDDSSQSDQSRQEASLLKQRLTTQESNARRLGQDPDTLKYGPVLSKSYFHTAEIHLSNDACFSDKALGTRYDKMTVSAMNDFDFQQPMSHMASDDISAIGKSERNKTSMQWQLIQYRVFMVAQMMDVGALPRINTSISSQVLMALVFKGQHAGAIPKHMTRPFERVIGYAEVLTIMHACHIIFDAPDSPIRDMDHSNDTWLLLKPYLKVTQEIMMFALTLSGEFDNQDRVDLMDCVRKSFFGDDFQTCIGVKTCDEPDNGIQRSRSAPVASGGPARDDIYVSYEASNQLTVPVDINAIDYIEGDKTKTIKMARRYHITKLIDRDFALAGTSMSEYKKKQERGRGNPRRIALDAVSMILHRKFEMDGRAIPLDTIREQLVNMTTCFITESKDSDVESVRGAALNLTFFPHVLFSRELFPSQTDEFSHIPWTMRCFTDHIGKFFPENTHFLCGTADIDHDGYFQLVNIHETYDSKDRTQEVSDADMLDAADAAIADMNTETKSLVRQFRQTSIDGTLAHQHLRQEHDQDKTIYLTNSTHISQHTKSVLEAIGIEVGKSQPLYTKLDVNPDEIAQQTCRQSYSVNGVKQTFKSMVGTHESCTPNAPKMSDSTKTMHATRIVNADLAGYRQRAIEHQGADAIRYPEVLGLCPRELASGMGTTSGSVRDLSSHIQMNITLLEQTA